MGSRRPTHAINRSCFPSRSSQVRIASTAAIAERSELLNNRDLPANGRFSVAAIKKLRYWVADSVGGHRSSWACAALMLWSWMYARAAFLSVSVRKGAVLPVALGKVFLSQRIKRPVCTHNVCSQAWPSVNRVLTPLCRVVKLILLKCRFSKAPKDLPVSLRLIMHLPFGMPELRQGRGGALQPLRSLSLSAQPCRPTHYQGLA